MSHETLQEVVTGPFQCVKTFMWLAGSLYASEGDTRASHPGDKVTP